MFARIYHNQLPLRARNFRFLEMKNQCLIKLHELPNVLSTEDAEQPETFFPLMRILTRRGRSNGSELREREECLHVVRLSQQCEFYQTPGAMASFLLLTRNIFIQLLFD
jgi:hypothetical protein